jgi:hypothetical protein
MIQARSRTAIVKWPWAGSALLLVSVVVGCTSGDEAADALVWRVASFGDVCTKSGRFASEASATSFMPPVFDRIKEGIGGTLWMVDRSRGRVVSFQRDGHPLESFGRLGDGPGEFRFPSDVGVFPDSTLVVVDPSRMQVSELSPAGQFSRSFRTTRFAGRRIATRDSTEILVGGLNDVGTGLKLLARYRRGGDLIAHEIAAPALLERFTPRVDDVVLATGPDGEIVIASVVLPQYWVLRPQGTTEVALGFPEGVWHQLRPYETPPRTPAQIRAWIDSASVLTAGHVRRDGNLMLGVHTGDRESGKNYLTVIPLLGQTGSLLEDVPGWILGLAEDRVWIFEKPTSDSNAVSEYRCPPAVLP